MGHEGEGELGQQCLPACRFCPPKPGGLFHRYLPQTTQTPLARQRGAEGLCGLSGPC